MSSYQKSFAALVLLSASALSCGSAFASTVAGPYVSGGVGYDLTQTQHGHFTPGSGADGMGGGSAAFRHQNGYTGFGSVGWGFGNGLRAEVEGAYQYSQMNHVSHAAAPGRTAGGDQTYGGLVNVLYDIDLKQHFGISTPLTPYVGFGAGYMWTDLHDLSTAYANGLNTRWSGQRGGFAYQGIAGVAYDVPQVPGLALTADYRMMGQTFYNGAFNSGTTGSGAFRSSHVNYDPRFNHQFTLGLRYAFGRSPNPEPSPPATPVLTRPPLPVSRTYLVFFDNDSAALSSRASQIVGDAARTAESGASTSIHVNGYTDTSSLHGGERGQDYNRALSERRALAVKAQLVRDGIQPGEIAVRGYGETHPLVPTGPNTVEPQNRRTEIIIDN